MSYIKLLLYKYQVMEPSEFTDLAVYRKALEIFKVTRAIAYNIGNSRSILEMAYSSCHNERVAGELVTHSLQLAPGLAAVRNSQDLQLRQKRAEKLRRSVRKILVKCKKMEFSGEREKEFLTLLRNDLQHFDLLFSEWLIQLQLKHRQN